MKILTLRYMDLFIGFIIGSGGGRDRGERKGMVKGGGGGIHISVTQSFNVPFIFFFFTWLRRKKGGKGGIRVDFWSENGRGRERRLYVLEMRDEDARSRTDLCSTFKRLSGRHAACGVSTNPQHPPFEVFAKTPPSNICPPIIGELSHITTYG